MQPAAVALALPGDAGSVEGAATRETLPGGGTRLRYGRHLRTAPALLPPEFYPALLEINRALVHPSQRTVVIDLVPPRAGQ